MHVCLCLCLQSIAHPKKLLEVCLDEFLQLLKSLEVFLDSPRRASGSVLLEEAGPHCKSPMLVHSPSRTPILHKLAAVNSFIQLFIDLSKASHVGYSVSWPCARTQVKVCTCLCLCVLWVLCVHASMYM